MIFGLTTPRYQLTLEQLPRGFVPFPERAVAALKRRGGAQTPDEILQTRLDHGPLGVLWRPKYFTWSGIAIHGYTSVPPYPASHGCTRVSNAAVDWMWANNILPIGLTVWVY